VDARGYVQLTLDGRYDEALHLVREKLPFPGILGYLCTHPCELHCKRIDRDSGVRIRDIKRFLAEQETGEPRHILDREPRRSEKIAVIGAGPAGLIAAHDLTRRGYPVTLFEREPEIGGCLARKIPRWRVPRAVVERDLSIIASLQIDVRTGVRVGHLVQIEELRREYRAVLLLCGYEGVLDLLRDEAQGLRRTVRNTVKVNPRTCETHLEGVFAGGEAVSGPATVIESLALGRRCAESAHRFLSGGDPGQDREDPLPGRLAWTLEIDETERRKRERTPEMLAPFPDPLDEAGAIEEAERCLDCHCGLCVDDCEFLARHCRSPKDLARRVTEGLEREDTLRMIYSCNLCGLCKTVCPENLDAGVLLHEARRKAVRLGKGPLPEHKRVLSSFRKGTSKLFRMVMSEPGRGRSKRLFFPGCSLTAVSPGHVLTLYEELRRRYRGTGVLLYCCGAPVDALGMQEESARAKNEMLRMVEQVGAEELVTVCPECTYNLRARVPELEVTTVWEYLAEPWTPPRRRDGVVVAVHDSCKSRGELGVQASVRGLLQRCGATVVDPEYSGPTSRCCGFGGRIEPVDPELTRRIAGRRVAESPLPMVTYCAGCRTTLAAGGGRAIHLLDFLLSGDWRKAMGANSPGRTRRYLNRLRAKSAFKRLRPLGAE
jgi:NADPH-dependent glutamate synthase beta subunit-like oxidoreductase